MEKVSQQKKAFRLTIAAVGCLLLSILGALVMTVLHDYLSNKISSTIMSDMIVDSPNSPAYEPWVNSSNQYAGRIRYHGRFYEGVPSSFAMQAW